MRGISATQLIAPKFENTASNRASHRELVERLHGQHAKIDSRRHARRRGLESRDADHLGRRVRRHDMMAGARQMHGVLTRAATEFEDPLAAGEETRRRAPTHARADSARTQNA